MIDILENILITNQYLKLEFKDEKYNSKFKVFAASVESDREEYFCIINWKKIDNFSVKLFLEEIADEIFDYIRSQNNIRQSFTKNSTLLIFFEKNEINNEDIYKIEEDEYNFKKNVIVYKKEELSSLKSLLEIEKNLSIDLLNTIINGNEGEDFRRFKEKNEMSLNYYPLVIQMMLKIPFLKYKPKGEMLINLEHQIFEELEIHEKKIYEKLDSLDFNFEANDLIDFFEGLEIND